MVRPVYVLRQFHTSWREHFAGVVAPILLLLATTLAAGTAARQWTAHFSNVGALVLGCLCIFVAGGVVVYTVVLRPSDRAFLLAKLRFSAATKAL